MVGRRWKRYGRAAVVVGDPVSLDEWFAANPDLFTLAKPERMARVQALSDRIMNRIGELVPVTPVPLVCAAVQSLDRDWIPRAVLIERIAEIRETLVELNGRVVRMDRSVDETLEVALRMLTMRRVLIQQGDGFAVSQRNRELVSYYANSIAHLIGPFSAAVVARDQLPAERFAAGVV
jgi:glycerol-3-phosphate O-acyltransferase